MVVFDCRGRSIRHFMHTYAEHISAPSSPLSLIELLTLVMLRLHAQIKRFTLTEVSFVDLVLCRDKDLAAASQSHYSLYQSIPSLEPLEV